MEKVRINPPDTNPFDIAVADADIGKFNLYMQYVSRIETANELMRNLLDREVTV